MSIEIPLKLRDEYQTVVDTFNSVGGTKYHMVPFPYGRHEKYIKNFLSVTEFLVEFKGEKKKSLRVMAQDYFVALKCAHLRLHDGGFKIAQIDSKYSKDTFKRFVEKRSHYFDDGWIAKTDKLMGDARRDFERAL